MADNDIKERNELDALGLIKKKTDLNVISKEESLKQLADKANTSEYAMSLIMIIVMTENIVIFSPDQKDKAKNAITNVELLPSAQPVIENVIQNPHCDDEVAEVVTSTIENIRENTPTEMRDKIEAILNPERPESKIDSIRNRISNIQFPNTSLPDVQPLYGVRMPSVEISGLKIPGNSNPKAQTKYGVSRPPVKIPENAQPICGTLYGGVNGFDVFKLPDGKFISVSRRDQQKAKEMKKEQSKLSTFSKKNENQGNS